MTRDEKAGLGKETPRRCKRLRLSPPFCVQVL